MKELQMVKSRNQNMQKHPLPLPNSTLFDKLEKVGELSSYDKKIFYDSMFHWKWVMDSVSLSLARQRALTNDNL